MKTALTVAVLIAAIAFTAKPFLTAIADAFAFKAPSATCAARMAAAINANYAASGTTQRELHCVVYYDNQTGFYRLCAQGTATE